MIKIVIGDDEEMIRTALVALLNLEEDIEVVGHAPDGDGALALTKTHRPDVVLLDLEMPPDDGVHTAGRIRALPNPPQVVIITRHARPGVLKRALEAGVSGFVPKSTEVAVLAGVIRDVAAGHRRIDSEVAADAINSGASPMTPREIDILTLVARNATATEISAELSLATGTVRNYLSSAMAKLGAPNRHAAVNEARRRGWI